MTSVALPAGLLAGAIFLLTACIFLWLQCSKPLPREEDQTKSTWSWCSPHQLLAFRACVFAYCLGICSCEFHRKSPAELRFYTVWNFTLLTLTFGMGTLLSLSIFRRPPRLVPPGEAQPLLDRGLRILESLWVAAFSLEVCTCLLVSMVYWSILFPQSRAQLMADRFLLYLDTQMHAANSVFMLIELFLNRVIPPARYVLLAVIWPTMYGVFAMAYETHVGGAPIYSFLNIHTPALFAWLAGLIALHAALFALVWKLATCKVPYMGTHTHLGAEGHILESQHSLIVHTAAE